MMFSIIVPVYNVEAFLEECIESILNQEYKNFEILLIDDGSTDNSGQLCDEYAKKYSCIRTYHKENGGLSDARNCGISHAKGNYLIFIDSDDWILEGCLEKFAAILEDDSIDVLVTRLVEVYGEDIRYKDKHFEKYLLNDFTRERAIEWIMKYSENSWPAPKNIISTRLVKKNDLNFVKGRLHEDLDWTSNVCYVADKYAGCADAWYCHRMNRYGSITSSVKEKNITDVIEMAGKHYNYYKEHKSSLNRMIYERIMCSVYSSINRAKNCSADGKKAVAFCIRENREIFSCFPRFSHMLFVLMMRIIGEYNALKVISKL